jgi:rhodanese-related sulfurtransferase
MKKTITLFLLSLFAFSGFSCAQITSSAYKTLLKTLYKDEVPLVSCEKARKMDPVLFLDTRAYEEFKVSHIPQARWVGYEDFTLQRVSNVPKDTPIVVYCSVGVRSEKVGKKMLDAGYTNVRNLYGSIFEWVNQGYPVVNMEGEPTDKVHAYSRAWGVWLQKGEKVYE